VLISEPYSVAEAKTHKVALRGRSAFGHDFPTIEYKALSEEHSPRRVARKRQFAGIFVK
jgi:hypothetical protein